MTTTNFLAALIKKLVDIRVFVRSEIKDANKHPKAMMRGSLDGFLRVTQAELLEALGEKSPKKLTVKVRKAIAIVARIHKGCDSYKTIAEKAEVLIKRLSPIYKAELERVTAEANRKAAREKLEQSFRDLSGGKALPDGFETHVLADMVSDLRDGIVAETVHLMGVCGGIGGCAPEGSEPLCDPDVFLFPKIEEAPISSDDIWLLERHLTAEAA